MTDAKLTAEGPPAIGPAADFDIGAEIAAARDGVGLTRRELARRSGVADTTIGRIERGELDPTVKMAGRILAALDRSLSVGEGLSRPSPRVVASGSLEEALLAYREDVARLLDARGCTNPRLTIYDELMIDTAPGWHITNSYALSTQLNFLLDRRVSVIEAPPDADELEARTLW